MCSGWNLQPSDYSASLGWYHWTSLTIGHLNTSRHIQTLLNKFQYICFCIFLKKTLYFSADNLKVNCVKGPPLFHSIMWAPSSYFLLLSPCQVLGWVNIFSVVRWFTLLYCTVRWFTLLYCNVRWFTLLYCIVRWFTLLYCKNKKTCIRETLNLLTCEESSSYT